MNTVWTAIPPRVELVGSHHTQGLDDMPWWRLELSHEVAVRNLGPSTRLEVESRVPDFEPQLHAKVPDPDWAIPETGSESHSECVDSIKMVSGVGAPGGPGKAMRVSCITEKPSSPLPLQRNLHGRACLNLGRGGGFRRHGGRCCFCTVAVYVGGDGIRQVKNCPRGLLSIGDAHGLYALLCSSVASF
jgi:hypothetical protein